MSAWTHINANIVVDFGYQTEYFIRDFFSRMKDEEYMLCYDVAKKGRGYEITGSEMNAVIVACPLRDHVMDGRDRYFHGNTWSISINGHLRDRRFNDTLEEWHRFAWRLAWFVHHDCKRCADYRDGYDNTSRHPEIEYYNVDIVGDHNEWYHRSSVRGDDKE